MSMFRKYLNIITESNDDLIIRRIKNLEKEDIKTLDDFDDFNDLYYNGNDNLKQIAYLYATDVPDGYSANNFESFKKFILDNRGKK